MRQVALHDETVAAVEGFRPVVEAVVGGEMGTDFDFYVEVLLYRAIPLMFSELLTSSLVGISDEKALGLLQDLAGRHSDSLFSAVADYLRERQPPEPPEDLDWSPPGYL